MKLVAEYLADAVKFERMSNDAKDPALKVEFKKQADVYRRLSGQKTWGYRRQPGRKMSALGQKRTCAAHKLMSALGQ